MKIYGQEYKLRFSVGAMLEIAELCPEKKIENIDQMMDASTEEGLEFICKMTEIMSKYGAIAQAFEEGKTAADFEAGPRLTKDVVMTLDMDQIMQLMNEIFEARKLDSQITVETAPVKKKAAEAKKE